MPSISSVPGSAFCYNRSLGYYFSAFQAVRGFLGPRRASREIVFSGGSVTENELAKPIVDAAYRVHTRLGPGLLESADQAAPVVRAGNRGLR